MSPIVFSVIFTTAYLSLAATGLHAADRKDAVLLDMSAGLLQSEKAQPLEELVKENILNAIGDRDPQTPLPALIAVGSQTLDRCDDAQVISPGGSTVEQFSQRLVGVKPQGRRPLLAGVELSLLHLKSKDNPAKLVIVTTGTESCRLIPPSCDFVNALVKDAKDVDISVIGYRLKGSDRTTLECLTKATGGELFAVYNRDQMKQAMQYLLRDEVNPANMSRPELKLHLDDSSIRAGQWIRVRVEGETKPFDRIRIRVMQEHPATQQYESFALVSKNVRVGIQAPAMEGKYQIELESADHKVLAQLPIDVMPIEQVQLVSPVKVPARAEFKISVEGTVNPNDKIVLANVEKLHLPLLEFEIESDLQKLSAQEYTIPSPSEPGRYEVRYLGWQEQIRGANILEVEANNAQLKVPSALLVKNKVSKLSWKLDKFEHQQLEIESLAETNVKPQQYSLSAALGEIEFEIPQQPGKYNICIRGADGLAQVCEAVKVVADDRVAKK